MSKELYSNSTIISIIDMFSRICYYTIQFFFFSITYNYKNEQQYVS